MCPWNSAGIEARNFERRGVRDMDKRITALEEKAAFQEHLLAQLNQALVSQQKKLMDLEARFNTMKDRLGQGALVKRQEDETPPPHY